MFLTSFSIHDKMTITTICKLARKGRLQMVPPRTLTGGGTKNFTIKAKIDANISTSLLDITAEYFLILCKFDIFNVWKKSRIYRHKIFTIIV